MRPASKVSIKPGQLHTNGIPALPPKGGEEEEYQHRPALDHFAAQAWREPCR